MPINDSIYTLDQDVLNDFVDGEKTATSIVDVACIVNRSLDRDGYVAHSVDSKEMGRINSVPVAQGTVGIKGKVYPVSRGWGRGNIFLVNFTYPGLNYGAQISQGIAPSFERYSKMGYTNLVAAAAVAGVISTAHFFPDANGRTAMGAAEVFARRYEHTGFSLRRLSREHVDALQPSLTEIGYSLMPEKLNPYLINASKYPKDAQLAVPCYPDPSSYDDLGELDKYMRDYAANIIQFVMGFDPQRPRRNHHVDQQIVKLAEILRGGIG